MHVHILKENLQHAVTVVSRFTAIKAQLPILSHLAFEAKDKQLFCSGTNLQVGIRMRVGAKIVSEGSIAVPARLLQQLTTTLPMGLVDLQAQAQQLAVSIKHTQAEIQALGTQDFPLLDMENAIKLCDLDYERDIKQLLPKVLFALSKDEARPLLTGVYWQSQQGYLAVTDGFRLSIIEKAWKTSVKELADEVIILSGDVVELALKVFEEVKEKNISLWFKPTTKQVFFCGEEVMIMGRVLQGEYPPFQAIVPQHSTMKVSLDVGALSQAIKSVLVFAADSGQIVKCKFKKDSLELLARSVNTGTNTVVLEITNEAGKELETAFNGRYILECLQHLDGDELVMELTESLKPVVFREEKNNAFKHIIMPVKT
jgi:DNA polymerase-3 subunit beta